VTYDRRGQGRSDRPGSGFDLDTLADDLAAVVATVGGDEVTLVGHSLGCSEVVRFLARHPDVSVARVVLVAPVLPFLVKTPDNPEGIDASALAARAAAISTDVGQWCADNTEGFFGTATVSRGLTDWLVRQIIDTPLPVLLATMAPLADDLRADVEKVSVPVLVVHGDADDSAPIDITGRRCVELAPDARLVVYPGAGHGLFASHHAQLNADIAAFAGLPG
jgi:pimeloyl-ACP methyl ester carboxylesterase